MTVTEFIENEDGSASIKMDLTDQEKQQLLEKAFLDMLRVFLEQS